MRTTVEGIFRNGEVQLRETPAGVEDGMRVLVTFLTRMTDDLEERGIGPEAAAELRARLVTFADEWDSPEMDIYDYYDAARSALQTW
jgi:hypothetical protein